MRNALTVNVQITRIELVDLMIACTGIKYYANDGGTKWKELHDKLKSQLDEFDKMMDEYDETNR